MLAALLLTSVTRATHAGTAAVEMAGAATSFLKALDEGQKSRANFSFGDAERQNWHFIPRERRGLPYKDMTPAQRHLATALLASGLSQRGFVKATTIMSLEQILLEIEKGTGPKRDPENYYWSIFGAPSDTAQWGWRVEGHHLSINFTIAKGEFVATTPIMFGTNPGEVREGPRKGQRVLGAEEDLGRELVRSLDAKQRQVAVIATEAPKDIVTAAERKVSPLSPTGLAASDLNRAQRQVLHRLIDEYVRRVRPELADVDLAKIEKAGFGKVHFAWAGSDTPGQGHYYRVQGPTFLLEYDNTQNNANHVHSVWRDFRGDFGEDLLAEHYLQSSH